MELVSIFYKNRIFEIKKNYQLPFLETLEYIWYAEWKL